MANTFVVCCVVSFVKLCTNDLGSEPMANTFVVCCVVSFVKLCTNDFAVNCDCELW
jgi:hypothetical protein